MDDIVWLLGAGASRDAGLPLAPALTRQVLEKFNSGEGRARGDAASLNYVVSAILGHRGRSGADPATLPDIETVASAIELLRDRDDVELTPFVQSWDPGAVAGSRPTNIEAHRLGQQVQGAILDKSLRNFPNALYDYVTTVSSPSAGAPHQRFGVLLTRLLNTVSDLLQIDDDARLGYLKPLVELGLQPGGVTIGTLNYDLSVEKASIASDVTLSNGIDGWRAEDTVSFPDEGVRLYKLHGSVDWRRSQFNAGVIGGTGEFGAARERPKVFVHAPETPFVVFGRREKLRADGPFLDLLAGYRQRLATARCLIIVGYSFADIHINELVARWTMAAAHPDRILIVVDPNYPGGRKWGDNDRRFDLRDSLQMYAPAQGVDPRVLLSNRFLAVREKAESAIADLASATLAELVDRVHSSESQTH